MMATLAAIAYSAPAAAAAMPPRLHASLAPEIPAHATTITIAFSLGQAQSPLVGVELRLPSGVTAGFNTLGIATCTEQRLLASGPSGCPHDSIVGWGHGVVSVPVGLQQIPERVNVTIFMAPATGEHTAMLFSVRGEQPVIAQLVFTGSLEGDNPPFGARLDTEIPPVAGLPGSPDAQLVSLETQIAPKRLKYYRRAHGRTIGYTPEGFDVPASCPRHGFPFAARFIFADGSRESAATRVPCPRAGGRQ